MQPETNSVNHISELDLERYWLGMVKDEGELASLEEHLVACPACGERAASTLEYVDTIRAALKRIQEG
jgi:anti-sigma factor RsiW